MAKQQYSTWYYYAKPMVIAERVLNRKQVIKDGAGIKGADIDVLPAGTKLMVDLAEVALGWTRIISVDSYAPVPQVWIDKQAAKIPQEREAWADNTALSQIEPPAPTPEPTGREWTYEITVREILKKK